MKVALATATIAAFGLGSLFLATELGAQPTKNGPPPSGPHGTPQTCYWDDAASCPNPKPLPQPKLPPRPKVIIIGVKQLSSGPCTPGSNAIFVYGVTVKNVGNAPHVVSNHSAIVNMYDLHQGAAASSTSWAPVFLTFTPPLQPGQTTTDQVHIPYYTANPAHMTSFAVHPFQTVVLAYDDTSQNAQIKGPIVLVPAPKGCP
jgi:hypothetical protein